MVQATPALAAPPKPAASEEAAYTLAFQDAQISQVAEEVLGDLGLKFRIDPSVTGKISFRIEQRLTKAQLLQAFEAALAANNVALVREGETLVVVTKSQAKAVAGLQPMGESVRRVGYQIVAVPLAYASASEVAKALDAIAGSGAVVFSSDKLGLIVLGGSGQELQSALETLRVFDQSSLQASKIRWFELSQAPAETVAGELDGMLRAAGVSGVSIAPLKRLNGLIVFGRTNQSLDEVSQWVFRLDAPTKDAVSTLWAYHPKNTSAEALSRTLNSLAMTPALSETTTVRSGRATATSSSGTDSAAPSVAAIQTSAATASDD
jgi:general secretion pathway protein D